MSGRKLATMSGRKLATMVVAGRWKNQRVSPLSSEARMVGAGSVAGRSVAFAWAPLRSTHWLPLLPVRVGAGLSIGTGTVGAIPPPAALLFVRRSTTHTSDRALLVSVCAGPSIG